MTSLPDNRIRKQVAALKSRLETRILVERAKGLLIKQGMKEPEAHRKIQKLAMNKRQSLKEVAEEILLMED